VCIVRTSYDHPNTSSPFHIGIALLECCLADNIEEPGERLDGLDLLAADFFDDESIVVVLRLRTEDGKPEPRSKGSLLIVIENHRSSIYSNSRLQRFRVSRTTASRIRNYTRPRRFNA